MKYQHLQSIIKKLFNERASFNTFETVMKKIVILLLIVFTTPQLFAQGDTVSMLVDDSMLSSKSMDSAVLLSNVNVFKDPRLSALSNRGQVVARNKARYVSRVKAKEEIIRKRKEKLGVSGSSKVKSGAAIKRGKKVVTGSIVTRRGYRVNIYSGSSRTAAVNMKRKFMRSHRGVRSYMSYISPYFKIRVGNYASKKSAYRMLRKLQSSGFPKSFVVPDIVTVKNINVR
jgi:hypothetical protein